MGVSVSANKHWIEQTCDSPMASTSTRGTLSTSCTSSTHNLKHEVFLSFHGADTYDGFPNRLHNTLKSLGIVVSRDDDKWKREEILPCIKEAIERSQYAIVIITKRFAESKSCLFELSAIMECKQKGRITVFPVFYRVDPSNVRNQKGKFGDYIAQLKKNAKVVLKEAVVGNVSGWRAQSRYELEVIEEISTKIWERLIHNSTNIDKSLVGIESPTKEIMKLLQLDLGGIRYIGICGVSGIGKTTLAQVIYQIASPKFEACCFVHGIGDKEGHHLMEFKKQLIYAILSKDVADSWTNSEYEADMVLRTKLKNKKVLIILDDVQRREQLDALAKAEWFGESSRIIITSKSHDWPCLYKDSIYKVNTLNYGAALKLFCSKAFPECRLEEKFQGLTKETVYLAKGHPLVLEVFGSYLSNKGKDDWEGFLHQLRANPDLEVKISLQIAFDKLKGQGQLREAFLDIVCFFNDGWHRPDRDHLREKLVWLGYPSNILTDLQSKSLIKFPKNKMMFEKEKLFIHDLLVQMGQEIADQERLWRYQDIISILQENPRKIEMDKLKILQLKPSLLMEDRPTKLCFGAFSKMKNLRMVSIDDDNCLQWCGEYAELKLSNELRSLDWSMYPFESLPAGFNPTNLIKLHLSDSSIKRLWDGNRHFWKLKDISLRGSSALREIPDLSQVPNLEILDLSYCTNLSSIHPSVGLLKQLKELICMDCESLERLPDRIVSKSLEVLNLYKCSELKGLPNEICSESLKDLDLSHCLELENLPAILGKMPSLQYISIDGVTIEEFPFSFGRLPFLMEFHAEGTWIGEFPIDIVFSKEARVLTVAFHDSNTSLRSSPSPLSTLRCRILHGCIPSDEAESSDLSGLFECSHVGHRELSGALFSSLESLLDVALINCNLEAIPKFTGYSSVLTLDLSKNRFTELPDSLCELSILELVLNDCTSLQSLPKLPLSLKSLELQNCPLLPTGVCSSVVTYIGFDCKPHKILNLHPQDPLYMRLMDDEKMVHCIELKVACGPTLGIGIPKWFSHKSTTFWLSGEPKKLLTYESNRSGVRHPPPLLLCVRSSEKKKKKKKTKNKKQKTKNKKQKTKNKSTTFNKTIQIHMDWDLANGSPDACALLIVYEVYEHDKSQSKKQKFDELKNSDISACEGNNHIFPEFVCQLQCKEVSPQLTFVIRVPEVAHVGTHGVWVFVSFGEFFEEWELEERSYLASITANSENVELKESAARLLNEDTESDFLEVVSNISRPGLDSKSIGGSLRNFLAVAGPIKPMNFL